MHTTMSAVLGLLVLQSVLAAAETGTGQETANVAIQTTNKFGITTKSGITYTNCTISRVEPNGITVFHAVGIAKIPFTDLPEELQAKYNYNPTNAAAYTRSVNQKQAEAEAWEKQQTNIKKQREQSGVNKKEQPNVNKQEQSSVNEKSKSIGRINPNTGQYEILPIVDGKIVYPRDRGDMLADIAEQKMKAKEKEKHRHIGE